MNKPEKTDKSDAWRIAEPALTDETRLLLLFSRVRLDDWQLARAQELCSCISDWNEFASRAAEHFLAPLCLHHFSNMEGSPEVRAARSALMPHVRAMALQMLKLAAMQRRFVENHLLPLGMPFAVIKGRALAAKYYPRTDLRYARDLDVLVPEKRIPEVVMSAQADGFRLYPKQRKLSLDEAHMVTRGSRVLHLVGSDRIMVEVHAQLDKAGFLLDHKAALTRIENCLIDGVKTGILTTADHFVFICLHHSKHFWSRLNWLADLDALINSPSFDRDAVIALARQRGVEATVEACLELHWMCGSAEPWQEAQSNAHVRDLMRACLLILEKGASFEFDLRPDRLSLDFNYEWQFPKGFEQRLKWQQIGENISPSMADYVAMPLPKSWHWVYYATRPFRLLFRPHS